MPLKVGIPRSLLYYQFYPLWKTFFEEIGAEIVVSDPTTKRILDDGVKCCVDEACLPVKLFHGHVINLKDRVDYLFMPRLTSISRGEYVCPKFGGLPDMVKASLKGLPKVIATDIDLRKSGRNAIKAALEIGHYITEEDSIIKKAYRKALENYYSTRKEFKQGIVPDFIATRQVMDKQPGEKDMAQEGNRLNIALIGHVYNVYDSYVNMNLLQKLENRGANVITIDMVDEKDINRKADELPKRMFWNYGRKAVGAAMHLLDRKDLDGIIYLMSFGCGIDAFICDLIERKVRRSSDTPFIIITIDEHSGEAGLDTRIEAFIDMILWRNRNEIDISALG